VAAEFKYASDYPTRLVTVAKFIFRLKKWWRFIRVQRPVTTLLGPQYRPSHDLIEIDITYHCNLRCLNCNRSCTQAPSKEALELTDIRSFVDESIVQGRDWRRIRVLGGEPTHHPQFSAIIDELLRYKAHHAGCKIEVVTNGYGKHTRKALASLPHDIEIENSAKTSNVQPSFAPFNLAPVDDRTYRFADYTNGCSIMDECGIGLTPRGYYPCAVAGGIDRVLGGKTGRSHIPAKADDMKELLQEACSLCGRFYDGHYVPPKLRSSLDEAAQSPSWQQIYKTWNQREAKETDDSSKTTAP
tara:strand:+ start:6768 stop:7667 length:900 start_codon:yes stop_codon:yes gene_type:complete